MLRTIDIIIADDHPIFRKGLRQLIESSVNSYAVKEAEDGKSALQFVEELKPDVTILDVDMPEMNGLEVAKEIEKRRLKTKVIFLTMYKEEELFNEALDHGVLGYILKDNAAKEILNALNAVMKNEYYICPTISNFLVNRNLKEKKLAKSQPGLDDLTHSEKNILRLIAESKTSKEIADELHISYRTVENHRTNICAKLNIHGSHALLKFAFDNKHLL
ncbi:MAG: response regulator transcription factor [Ignavibacteriae bacterium]|nr:response regulator transcription factor [Ignavibacteriota bacterium]